MKIAIDAGVNRLCRKFLTVRHRAKLLCNPESFDDDKDGLLRLGYEFVGRIWVESLESKSGLRGAVPKADIVTVRSKEVARDKMLPSVGGGEHIGEEGPSVGTTVVASSANITCFRCVGCEVGSSGPFPSQSWIATFSAE